MKLSIYKVIVLIFGILVCNYSFLIPDCPAQWEQVSNGMFVQRTYALAVNGNYMYAGTEYGGVYYSTDYGTNWIQTSLNNRNIRTLAVSGNYVFAGDNALGVFLSTDNGATWNLTTLGEHKVLSIAVSGNNVYAGVGNWADPYQGLYLSTDLGETWTLTSLNFYISSVTVNGNNIYAGVYTTSPSYGLLYLSTDNCASWEPTSLNFAVYSLVIDGNRMYTGAGGNMPENKGIFVSTDYGENWIRKLNDKNVFTIAASGNYVFAGTLYQPYFSTDYGASWAIRSEGLPSGFSGFNDFEIINNYVYAATSSGVWRNPNNYFTLFKDDGLYTGFTNWVTNQGWDFTWAISNGAFTDSPGKNYSTMNYKNNTDNSMTLKNALDVSNYENLKVSFTHKYLTQAGKDFCHVEVSSDNGTNWGEAISYSGIQDQMIQTEVDITSLANQSENMKIRFRLTSDKRIVNDGWYVTNIIIIGKTANGNFNDNIITNEIPKDYFLGQNYPNPFNPTTNIKYQIAKSNYITLKVYDVLGKEIVTLVNEKQSEGTYQVDWDGSNYPSGVYFYKLIANEYTESKKMVLIK